MQVYYLQVGLIIFFAVSYWPRKEKHPPAPVNYFKDVDIFPSLCQHLLGTGWIWVHTSPPLTDIPDIAGVLLGETAPRQEAHGLISKCSVFVEHRQHYLQHHPPHSDIHSLSSSLSQPFV